MLYNNNNKENDLFTLPNIFMETIFMKGTPDQAYGSQKYLKKLKDNRYVHSNELRVFGM
jgi:hypothetical protein